MNLRRAAVSLREAAERELGVRAKIKTGSNGEMSVLVDGTSIFSYKKEGGMPETSELLRRITAAQAR
ncbi:MAG TPA: Rdx family protein [Candidatus Angelobacter sp.]